MSTVILNDSIEPLSVVVSPDAPVSDMVYVCTSETDWANDDDVSAADELAIDEPTVDKALIDEWPADESIADESTAAADCNAAEMDEPTAVVEPAASPAARNPTKPASSAIDPNLTSTKATSQPVKARPVVAKAVLIPAKAKNTEPKPTRPVPVPAAHSKPTVAKAKPTAAKAKPPVAKAKPNAAKAKPTSAKAVSIPTAPRSKVTATRHALAADARQPKQAIDQGAPAVVSAIVAKSVAAPTPTQPTPVPAPAPVQRPTVKPTRRTSTPAVDKPAPTLVPTTATRTKKNSDVIQPTSKRARTNPATIVETSAPQIRQATRQQPVDRPRAGRNTSVAQPTDFGIRSVALSEPERVPQKTYGEWFKEKVVQSKWMTSFCAFYTHWLLLILLAIIVVHGPNRTGDFTITASTAIPIDYEPVQVLDTRIVEPQPEAARPETQAATTVPMDMSVTRPALPDAFAASESIGEPEVAESKPVYSPTAVRLPRNAVTSGSFSVWTIPEYPEPGESYKVMIRAKVPAGVTRYPITDLQGVVVGSDGYRKLIPGSLRGFLPIHGGYVQFEVPIVAADQEIKDTVWIQSRMLREQQKLLIEF